MPTLLLPFPLQRPARRHFFSRPAGWLVATIAVWSILLLVFRAAPQIDLAVAAMFFRESACWPGGIEGRICGFFPSGDHSLLVAVRKILFYLPAAVGLVILYRLLDNFQHHGATYCHRKTRDHAIALTALLIGPYLLVNLVIKQISARPRPYDTTMFGGRDLFAAAGDFGGACTKNCSFISGEAAGAGWMACLIVLLPKRLRPLLTAPIIILSLISPALRVSFGGHYFSDVVLGWLSSLIVYAAVAACFEMSQEEGKHCPPTFL